MRRPCADCEEKRVTYGDDEPDDDADQEQLDLDNPNQRGLSYQLREPRGSRSVALPLRHCGPDRLTHLLEVRCDVVDVIRLHSWRASRFHPMMFVLSLDRKSTRLKYSHSCAYRMPTSA